MWFDGGDLISSLSILNHVLPSQAGTYSWNSDSPPPPLSSISTYVHPSSPSFVSAPLPHLPFCLLPRRSITRGPTGGERSEPLFATWHGCCPRRS